VTLLWAGSGLTLLAAWSLGRAAWRYRAPHWTLALATGAPLLSLAVFILLLFQQATAPALIALCAAACLLARPAKPGMPQRPHWLAALALPFFVLYLIHALTPETQPDGTTYHLGLVAEWLRLHGFSPRIGFYEMLPLGMETLFAPAFAIGQHSAAKLVHFGFLLATVPLILRIARRLGCREDAAWSAALLLFCTPVLAISGAAAYNDAALVFFHLAAFALLLEDHPLAAGLTAGFCFAIKITGIFAVIAGLAWLLYRRRWHDCSRFLPAAAVSILPWTLRDLWLTGNPLAPLANGLFPNDAFHAFTEQSLSRYLANYGGLRWHQIPWSLTTTGFDLQGFIGPVFLLLPLALLAWRKPAGRIVLCAAVFLLIPWTRNIGARFVLPSLAFFCLALALALPRPAIAALAVLHAITCWPNAAGLYTDPNAWRLRGFPWQAALRLESEDQYLAQSLLEYTFTRRAAQHLQPNEPLLDLYALPFAYLPTVPIGPLSSAQFDNLAHTLATAASSAPDTQATIACRYPLQFTRSLRIQLQQPMPSDWSIAEVQLFRDGQRVSYSRNWFLHASTAPGDAYLAADGNRATHWTTWDRAPAGAFWQLTFDRPIPLDGLSVILPNLDDPARLRIEAQGLDRRWSNLAANAQVTWQTAHTHRRAAMEFVRRQGIHWIAARTTGDGHAIIGESLLMFPEAWGVELVEKAGDAALFRLR
jgi:hypothetical protein